MFPTSRSSISKELEGVLTVFGLVFMLPELVRPMRMLVGPYGTSQMSDKIVSKIMFSSKSCFLYTQLSTLQITFCIAGRESPEMVGKLTDAFRDPNPGADSG